MNRLKLQNRVMAAIRRGLCALGANHGAALALIWVHDAMASRRIWPQGALQTLKEAVERLPGQVFRLAGYLDDEAPCPNCGKPEALIHLARLKTYCWACSYWGHDPKLAPEEAQP